MNNIKPLASITATGLAIVSFTLPRLADTRDSCIQSDEVVCYPRAPESRHGQEREVERAAAEKPAVEASASGSFWAPGFWGPNYWSKGHWA